MIYKKQFSTILFLFILGVFSFMCYAYDPYGKILTVLLFPGLVYKYTLQKIDEYGVHKKWVLLFWGKNFSFAEIEKVVCMGVPEMRKGGNSSNSIIFYSKNDCIKFYDVFDGSVEKIKEVKSILQFIESKGIPVFLFVPLGEENRQMFKGFEITSKFPEYPKKVSFLK